MTKNTFFHIAYGLCAVCFVKRTVTVGTSYSTACNRSQADAHDFPVQCPPAITTDGIEKVVLLKYEEERERREKERRKLPSLSKPSSWRIDGFGKAGSLVLRQLGDGIGALPDDIPPVLSESSSDRSAASQEGGIASSLESTLTIFVATRLLIRHSPMSLDS